MDDPKYPEIQKALERAGGRKAMPDRKNEDNLDDNMKRRITAWTNQMQGVVEQCKDATITRMHYVCK